MEPAIELLTLQGPTNAEIDRAEAELQRWIRRVNQVMADASEQEWIGAKHWEDIEWVQSQLRKSVVRCRKLGVRLTFRLDRQAYRHMPQLY